MERLLDPTLAETRVLFDTAEAEVAQRTLWRSTAVLLRSVDEVLREAARHPEVFVDEQMLRGDATELTVRAAVADLAVRLSLSEGTVRNDATAARLLRECLPSLWAAFCEGDVSPQNARAAADLVLELPQSAWSSFDEALIEPARQLAPARFRVRARALREKLHPVSLSQRHESARADRRVWHEHDRDGMSWLHAYLPSEQVARIEAQLDGAALDLFRDDDETRTIAQLRADLLADLVIGDAEHSRVSVAITIPALALLGESAESPLLEGVGPVDLDTARRLAGHAPAVTRLLTHPVSGVVLQLDPRQYRVSAALRRWLRVQHPTCDFPGCGRRAASCDLDHTEDFANGGLTTAQNLVPRCRKHHTMKHQSRWQVHTPPGSVRSIWTSPTGHSRAADPPPF